MSLQPHPVPEGNLSPASPWPFRVLIYPDGGCALQSYCQEQGTWLDQSPVPVLRVDEFGNDLCGK